MIISTVLHQSRLADLLDMTNETTSILNPLAAAAWLPPDIVPWYEGNRYAYAFLLGVSNVHV